MRSVALFPESTTFSQITSKVSIYYTVMKNVLKMKSTLCSCISVSSRALDGISKILARATVRRFHRLGKEVARIK